MNALKTAIELLKKLGVGVPAWVLVALALAVPLAVVAYKWFQARAAAKGKPEAAGPAPAAPPQPKPHADRFLAIWKRFLKGLEPEYRRSIFQFQPFVILGAAGSGKSQLIETCTDAKQQEQQLLGGALKDPELTLALGSRALYLELPATVLHDTSAPCRKALLRLWQPLFSKRKPIAVVALNAMELSATHADPDAVRTLANTLRGKINLLAQVCRKPIEVRVVLTHLDEQPGYLEFVRFLGQHNLPATLKVEPQDPKVNKPLEEGLRQRFADFERLLPLALTTRASADYLQLVSFLREARFLPQLGHFLEALCASNPLAPSPVVERVYFLGGKGEGARPFHASRDPDAAKKPDPYRNHRLAAVGCASLGILYLLAGYLYERRLWNPAYQAVLQYPEAKTPDYERKLRAQIARFTERKDSPRKPMRYLPSFFSTEEDKLDALYSQALRTHHLLPGLERALASDRPHRRSLYFLALLYATRDNALGTLIRTRSVHWMDATGLEHEVIETYLRTTSEPYQHKPVLDHLPTRVVLDATNDAQQWLLFFRRLERAFAGGPLSPEELAHWRQEADGLLEALKVIQQYKESPTILKELDKATNYGLDAIYEPALASVKASSLFGDGMPNVENLLKRVRGGELNGAEAEVRLLSDFNERAKALLTDQPGDAGETYTFQVDQQPFTFASRQWDNLIRKSATRELVRRFTSRPAQRQATSFFPDDKKRDALAKDPLGEGTFLFTGQAGLDHRYTRVAFDQYVRPVITDFNALVARLEEEGERTTVKRFVESEMRKYASSYVTEVDGYYHAFGVRADSRESLQLLLKQMLDPGSPFTEMLQVVRDNTHLELDEKAVPLFSPMKAALAKYAPLHKVLAEQESGASEFENYRAILEQLRQSLALEGGGAPEAAKAEEPKKEEAKTDEALADAEGLQRLPDLLSPAGRMSLAILHRQKGSYEDLVVTWLTSVKLHGELSGPFLAPVNTLHALGRKEIEETVARLWNDHILGQLSTLLRSFPFDPASQQDVKPEELTALFHPQTGRFHQLTRRFIEPISTRTAALGSWGKLGTGNGQLSVPSDLYETLNNVDVLTRRLWDSKGNPRPLQLTVGSVPFKSSASANSILTLVYLNSGTSSLLNFNQQPLLKALEIDWTRPRQARLSIETISPDSGSKTYPPAILSNISPWSLLHLLKDASRQGNMWSWSFPLGPDQQPGGGAEMTVTFKLQDDPWSLFVVRPRKFLDAPATVDTNQP
jgi:hypothetical protein